MTMFIYSIWLNNIQYKNFEGYETHFKRATKKMNFFLKIVNFFVFVKLKICGPKCWKNVQEIFMQKKMLSYI